MKRDTDLGKTKDASGWYRDGIGWNLEEEI